MFRLGFGRAAFVTAVLAVATFSGCTEQIRSNGNLGQSRNLNLSPDGNLVDADRPWPGPAVPPMRTTGQPIANGFSVRPRGSPKYILSRCNSPGSEEADQAGRMSVIRRVGAVVKVCSIFLSGSGENRADYYSPTGRMSGERQQRWPVAAC